MRGMWLHTDSTGWLPQCFQVYQPSCNKCIWVSLPCASQYESFLGGYVHENKGLFFPFSNKSWVMKDKDKFAPWLPRLSTAFWGIVFCRNQLMSGVFCGALRGGFTTREQKSVTLFPVACRRGLSGLVETPTWLGQEPIWLITAGGSLTPEGEQGFGALLCGLLRTLPQGCAAGLKAVWVIMILERAFIWTSNVTWGVGDSRKNTFYAADDVSWEQKRFQRSALRRF